MSVHFLSQTSRNIAIAEIVIFSVIQVVQCVTRYRQEWTYWPHEKRKSVSRCCFYAWYGLIGLVAQFRIAGSAMVLSGSLDRKVLIAEAVLRGIGLSPLLFEVSLVMLASGQAGRIGSGNSRYPKPIVSALHLFRFPVCIGIVLIVVGANADIMALKVVGAIALVVTFGLGYALFGWLAVAYRAVLSKAGYRCVLLVLVTGPPFVVRIVYMLLALFGSQRFHSAYGNSGVMVGMSMLMEIVIMAILFAARAVAQPVWGGVVADEVDHPRGRA
ncbi:hypothetical protein BDV25DRAFT_129744 [Aspergillus avenaceus]|uniref:DUF7702 domain-containing protein n=1 Tax=Aspergillus avenaceus TaxID=36643 RepID=A0A5N6TV99_ASPAV|nr:hypothetical protein BDV25DRAFT_129744 [Aspergillus avenaceus]